MAGLQLGDIAPNFTALTTKGEISFHEWIGDSWCIFFSHPGDFTPVCTTELGAASQLAEPFAQRNVKMIAISVDSLEDHLKWIDDINETQQTSLDFPIIADENKVIALQYGMIHPNASETHTVRTVLVIGPDKRIKLTICYPASTGRNFNELLRVIDSLQLTSGHGLATPANWTPGDDCIILPSISDAEATQKFPAGFRSVKPYLRYTKWNK